MSSAPTRSGADALELHDELIARLMRVHEHDPTQEEFYMLVLTRRIGQGINIGDDVVVTFLGFQGSQIRLGIAAPKETRILREEVFERDQAQKGQQP